MNLFGLTHALDQIGGSYPQVSDFLKGYNKDSPRSIYNLTYKGFPDFTPDASFILDKSSLQTDLLSCAMLIPPSNLVISAKLKSLLESSNLPPHRFYPANIHHKGAELQDYWLIHILEPQSFSSLDRESANGCRMVLRAALREWKKNVQTGEPIEPASHSRPEYIPSFEATFGNLDVFYIHMLAGAEVASLFISENLASKLKQHNVTGIKVVGPFPIKARNIYL